VDFLREAFRALRENIVYVALYALGFAVLDSLHYQVFMRAAGEYDPATDPLPVGPLFVGIAIARAVVAAALDTLFFSRLGREIDRPMWRVSNDADAFRLFFGMWLLLRLLMVTFNEVIGVLGRETSEEATLLILAVVALYVVLFLKAIGAAIMFQGRAGSPEVSEAFSVIGHHFGPVFQVTLFSLLIFLVAELVRFGIPEAEIPLRSAIGAGVNCIILTSIWLVCMYHRDHWEPPEDDFDF